jgi:hypothetical protein
VLADRNHAMTRALTLVMLLAATARAQPVTTPEATPPLAEIHDDKKLAEILADIARDPAVKPDDDKARPVAQALMTEGVHRLQNKDYDQALANFLEAYNKLPSPKILLNIASTLRDMGRLADAANTYQRYLQDPATGTERIVEVKQILTELDQQLTILTVRVFPRGSELSIDGGPYVPVGSSLQTRMRPGIHMVRIKKGSVESETTVNGFEGESKDVPLTIQVPVEDTKQPPVPDAKPPPPPPETVNAWLVTGTQYGAPSDNAASRERHVRVGFSGPEVAPVMTKLPPPDDSEPPPVAVETETIGSGVLGVLRIDGKGRGIAGGVGFAYAASDPLEIEGAVLKSDVWGVYGGIRYRFLTGLLRPYAAGGLPVFFFTDDMNVSHRAFGLRGAGGVELRVNGHMSLQADLGIEHFFNISNTIYKNRYLEETVFVPTVGVIGRL